MRAIAVMVLAGWALVVSACGLTPTATAAPAGQQTEVPVPKAAGPQPTQTPVPTLVGPVALPCWTSVSTNPSSGTVTIPGTAVSVDYSLPAALDLLPEAADGVVAFRTPFALPRRVARVDGWGTFPGSRGVAVVDVTRAVRHGS